MIRMEFIEIRSASGRVQKYRNVRIENRNAAVLVHHSDGTVTSFPNGQTERIDYKLAEENYE